MNITFIGGGNMSACIVGGMIQSNWSPNLITVSDPSLDKLQQLTTKFKVNTTSNNIQAIKDANIVILAVKPQVLKQICQDLKNKINSSTLIVSIVAGITSTTIRKWLDTKAIIVRTMPNTPALVQEGMTGIFCKEPLSSEQKNAVQGIFSSIGKYIWLTQESELDLVTAISGSGPAYFFLFFESVIKSAVKLGMDQDTAALLVQQTALGSAKMAIKSELSSQELKTNVMSPGGTTEQAINTLESLDFCDNIDQAIQAATKRSQEISTLFD